MVTERTAVGVDVHARSVQIAPWDTAIDERRKAQATAWLGHVPPHQWVPAV